MIAPIGRNFIAVIVAIIERIPGIATIKIVIQLSERIGDVIIGEKASMMERMERITASVKTNFFMF